ncbi:MAG TPA: septum formation initiator family protein [Candidatus Saccharimonadales bacterium]|nr:septum formation initiator family protein [Candidatus Saccharimonadales bacterium]
MFDNINIQTKIEPYLATLKAYVLSLRDIRNVGLLVFTIIVLLISWSGVKSIQTNYGLQKQIARLSQENQLQTLKNNNQALQNDYFKAPQYLEVSARQNLGLAAPGETELLVPKSVALAHTVKQPDAEKVDSQVPEQPFYQRNFQAWMDFFLHRGSAVD